MTSSNIKVGQILNYRRYDGRIVPVKVMGEPFFGAFGWSVRCLVISGQWEGQSFDIMEVHLFADS